MTHKNFSEVIFLLFSHHNDKERFDITVKQNAKTITGVFARLSLYSALGFACLVYLMPIEHAVSFMTASLYYLWVSVFLLFGVFYRSYNDGKKRLSIIIGSIFYGSSSLHFSDFSILDVFKFLGFGLSAFMMSAIFSICISLRRFFNGIIEQPEYDKNLYSSYAEYLQHESANEPWFDPLNEMWCNRLPEDDEFSLRERFDSAGRLDEYFEGKQSL